MLIVACQHCGEIKVIAGSPDESGMARAMWTCPHCGAGQIMELAISKNARRGDLRKIIGGLALVQSADNSEHGATRLRKKGRIFESTDSNG